MNKIANNLILKVFLINFASSILCSAIAYALSSTIILNQNQLDKFPNNLGTQDFFILKQNTTVKAKHKTQISAIDCRANISKTICIVEPATTGQQPMDRQCLDGGNSYSVFFEKIYDNYPPSLQKMFCSVKRIFIEKSFSGTAYAGAIYNSQGQPTGAIMGIRQSVLDQNLDLQTWASWKEQLSFGGTTNSFDPIDNLPRIETSSASKVSDFLYFVIAHEFGHIFDFANGLNHTTDCTAPNPQPGTGDCKLAPGTWGALSWERTTKPLAQNDFFNRTGLCFYNCPNPLSPQNVSQVYADLSQTNFISTYASTQPWDDFADSLAYYLISQNLNANYLIDTKQNSSPHVFDIMAKLHSDLFAEKYQYIQNFMNRKDLYYP